MLKDHVVLVKRFILTNDRMGTLQANQNVSGPRSALKTTWRWCTAQEYRKGVSVILGRFVLKNNKTNIILFAQKVLGTIPCITGGHQS